MKRAKCNNLSIVFPVYVYELTVIPRRINVRRRTFICTTKNVARAVAEAQLKGKKRVLPKEEWIQKGKALIAVTDAKRFEIRVRRLIDEDPWTIWSGDKHEKS
jgi:hypothetical protein